jgi:hypothetical protein
MMIAMIGIIRLRRNSIALGNARVMIGTVLRTATTRNGCVEMTIKSNGLPSRNNPFLEPLRIASPIDITDPPLNYLLNFQPN